MDKRVGLVLAMTAMMIGTRAFGEDAPAVGHKNWDPEGQFKMMDANGDGTVTKAECLAAPSPQWVGKNNEADKAKHDPAKHEAHMTKRFEAMDANHDGSLTKDEFMAACAKDGMHDKGKHMGMGGAEKPADVPPAVTP